MAMISKLRTLVSVYSTFGSRGVQSLILGKLNFRPQDDGSLEDQFMELDCIPVTLTELELVNILASNEALLFSQEYLELKNRWAEVISAPRNNYFKQIYDLGDSMGFLVYCYVRLQKPGTVVETGVAAGVSSSILMEALKMNGGGKLTSIDITNKVGEVIPAEFKRNWDLQILDLKDPRKSLRSILAANGDARVFLHDSDHSIDWQIDEFSSAIENFPKCQYLFFDDISPGLVKFVKLNYPEIQIHVIDEGSKFSGVFVK